jgi:hypothetical protein
MILALLPTTILAPNVERFRVSTVLLVSQVLKKVNHAVSQPSRVAGTSSLCGYDFSHEYPAQELYRQFHTIK